MTPRLYVYAALVIALFGAGVKSGMMYVQSQWNAQKSADSEENKNVVLEYANELVRKGEEHDTNQGIIDSLAIAAAGRVRVHFPICKSAKEADKDGGSRLLSERTDEIYGNHAERVGRIIKRADQLNIDAIEVNK